jgi:hypothetical protein
MHTPRPVVLLKAIIAGTEQYWYVYEREDDTADSVATRVAKTQRHINWLREKFGGESVASAPPQPVAVPAPQPPLEERDDWCSIHQVAMPTQRNERGEWKSHRLPDGTWCKGKRKRAGESA